MKRFTIGFVTGIVTFLGTADVTNLIDDRLGRPYFEKVHSDADWDAARKNYERDHPVLDRLNLYFINPNLGLYTPLSGRCTKDTRSGVPRRQYFQCNKLQTLLSDLIYGEFTK